MSEPQHARRTSFVQRVVDVTWLKAALLRAAYTVLAVLLPLVAGLTGGEVSFAYAGLLAGLAAILSMATSAASLPEVDHHSAPWWQALLSRTVRTIGQVLLASIGTEALLLTDVDWDSVLRAVLAGAVVTVVRFVMSYLPNPEVEEATTIRKARGE